MITKNDLVKKFELVVKQEIINHNRSISETNVSLNTLKTKIESLEKLVRTLDNCRENKFSSYTAESEKIFHKIFVTMELLEKKYMDFSRNTIKRIEENEKADKEQIRNILDSLHSHSFSLLEIQNAQEEDEKEREQLLANIKDFINSEIYDISVILFETKGDIEHLKMEKYDFEKRVHKMVEDKVVDIRGNKEEIEKIKKKQFVLEKTCEYLKTQLDRIKEGK